MNEPHVKITMNMMYAEQQQTNRMLAQAVTHLEHLADVPERLRQAEVDMADMKATVKDMKSTVNDLKAANRTAIQALIGAGLAIIGTIFQWVVGK